jgi:hypothetical protein
MLREEPDIEVVGEAANGREAVDLAVRLEPDVVVLDVAMPLMNGDEAARQMKLHLPRHADRRPVHARGGRHGRADAPGRRGELHPQDRPDRNAPGRNPGRPRD